MHLATKAHLIACALLLSAAAPPSEREITARKAAAKTEAEKATVLFNLGRFAEALTGYERAYELFQAPGLLFNLGQCHRHLGHHDRAVFFFSGYLREKPDAPNRVTVEDML